MFAAADWAGRSLRVLAADTLSPCRSTRDAPSLCPCGIAALIPLKSDSASRDAMLIEGAVAGLVFILDRLHAPQPRKQMGGPDAYHSTVAIECSRETN